MYGPENKPDACKRVSVIHVSEILFTIFKMQDTEIDSGALAAKSY